jgi:hypothetical protein
VISADSDNLLILAAAVAPAATPPTIIIFFPIMRPSLDESLLLIGNFLNSQIEWLFYIDESKVI